MFVVHFSQFNVCVVDESRVASDESKIFLRRMNSNRIGDSIWIWFWTDLPALQTFIFIRPRILGKSRWGYRKTAHVLHGFVRTSTGVLEVPIFKSASQTKRTFCFRSHSQHHLSLSTTTTMVRFPVLATSSMASSKPLLIGVAAAVVVAHAIGFAVFAKKQKQKDANE